MVKEIKINFEKLKELEPETKVKEFTYIRFYPKNVGTRVLIDDLRQIKVNSNLISIITPSDKFCSFIEISFDLKETEIYLKWNDTYRAYGFIFINDKFKFEIYIPEYDYKTNNKITQFFMRDLK